MSLHSEMIPTTLYSLALLAGLQSYPLSAMPEDEEDEEEDEDGDEDEDEDEEDDEDGDEEDEEE